MYHQIVKNKIIKTFKALSEGNYEIALSGMAKEFEHTFSGNHTLGGTRHSSNAMRKWFERLYRLNKKLNFTIKHISVSGYPWNTSAFVEWTDTAITATGDPYENNGVHIIRMKWGKVISLHAYLDTENFSKACLKMAQKGIEEAIAPQIVD